MTGPLVHLFVPASIPVFGVLVRLTKFYIHVTMREARRKPEPAFVWWIFVYCGVMCGFAELANVSRWNENISSFLGILYGAVLFLGGMIILWNPNIVNRFVWK